MTAVARQPKVIISWEQTGLNTALVAPEAAMVKPITKPFFSWNQLLSTMGMMTGTHPEPIPAKTAAIYHCQSWLKQDIMPTEMQ